MKKWYYNRKFIVTFLVFLISVITILIYNNRQYIISNFLEMMKYGFGIIGIVVTLYNYYHKFHLFISRIRIILLNSNSTWNVNAIFDGQFNDEILNKLKLKLIETNNNAEFIEINNNTFQAFIKGLTIYFEFTEMYNGDKDINQGHLVVRVRDYNASYNLAMETLDEKIIPLMTLISHKSKPEDSRYSFKIEFGKNNPFMGLAVKNIDKAALVDFSFMYNKENGISKRNVRVSKNGLECTTNTLSDFQTASGNFLSLVGK